MGADETPKGLSLPIAPLAAAILGVLCAGGLLAMPVPMLEGLVMDSGIPSVLAAAEPPLGLTARLMLAVAAGGGVAVFAWFALFLLLGGRGVTLRRAVPEPTDDDLPAPVIRRADAHPDARPRAPLLATRDLGEPAREGWATARIDQEPAAPAPTAEPEEQPLPADLEQPMAAFDPDAVPAEPLPPPVVPRAKPVRPPVFAANERFEAYELRPPVRRPAPPRPQPRPALRPQPQAQPREEAIARPETDASVHALLDRLEKGVVRRGLAQPAPQTPREAERGLEEALVTLRNLARRA